MPTIKLNKVAKELQIGVQSVIDLLRKQNPEGVYTPNSKLSLSELELVVKEQGGALSQEEKKAILAHYSAESVVPVKSGEKETLGSTTSLVAEKQDSPLTEKQKGTTGIKVLGRVQLDSRGYVATTTSTTPTTKIAEPTQSFEEKKEEKKEEAKKEIKEEGSTPSPSALETSMPIKEKKETLLLGKKKEEPKKDQEEEVAVVSNSKPEDVKSVVQEIQKEEKRKEVLVKSIEQKKEEKSETLPEQTKEEKEPVQSSSTTTKSTQEAVGIKVIGKVDLSQIETAPKKRDRKRIKGNRVDIEEQSREQKNDPNRSEKKKKKGLNNTGNPSVQNNAGKSTNSNTQQNASKNGNAKQQQGRKAKHQQKVQQKPEITQEDIQKQIKETMAALQGGRNKGTNTAARYRKDKREERRREAESLQEKALEADKILQLTEFVTPNDLAQMMDIPVNDIITLVFNLGMMVSINQRLEKDTIELIVEEYGYVAEFVEAQMMDLIEVEEDNEDDLEPRAPVVTVMGHVDHGKTSLLDAIRHTDVISGEAGGITQHVGAYRVMLSDGRAITFLDTPGHEAFTAMRARGAQVTDVVIIVVAADDGVMPQTREAISHAALAGVPIVFAINKIDREGANPERIKEELANLNYLVEDWGGKYQSQEISAKKGIGIYELLDKVLLEAELLELKANPHKRAIGSVLESTMEQGRGYTTKVLIKDGTLKVGDYIVAGSNYGRVKALFDEHGNNVKKVGPSEPVKVLGLNGATAAGEVLNALDTESEVRDIATRREQLQREQRERTQRLPSLMDLGRRIAEGKVQELNIIVKGDMDGSVEALSDSITKLSTDEVRVNVIYKAVGQITESDISLASASGAIIIGFQVRPAQGAKRVAEEEGVEIRLYSIIYDALDDVRTAMEGMLSPETKERFTANVEVRETFKITKVGTIAGCFVQEGKISRTDKVRVIRDGVVIHTGELASLKRFKDEAKEVVAGLECGINIANYNDIQVGDILEAYQEFAVKRTLS